MLPRKSLSFHFIPPQNLRFLVEPKAMGLEAAVEAEAEEVAVGVVVEVVISENTILEILIRKRVHHGFAKLVSVSMGFEKIFFVLRNPNSN